MKYVVTGINRLTGEREAVSIPCSERLAQLVFLRHSSIPARRRAYIRLKVEPAVGEGSLF